jgi:hypothetical protein
VQPATSATSIVASVEPPSLTITSRTRPRMAPATSMASVGTSVRSLFKVEMMTLTMGIRRGARQTGLGACASL